MNQKQRVKCSVSVSSLKYFNWNTVSMQFQITCHKWNNLNNVTPIGNHYKVAHTDVNVSIFKHEHFVSSSEWELESYSYELSSTVSLSKSKTFSYLALEIVTRRNEAFYTLTLFIPIFILTILSSVGLLLPFESGEKMGLQITILLTMVIYIEILQQNIPVFDSYGASPLLLNYFIICVISLCLCLLVSTFTLFLFHIEHHEVRNLPRYGAKIRHGGRIWYLPLSQ